MGLRAFALSALPDEPWRNGGGRTRTIAMQMRDAHSLDPDAASEPPWDWRISVATIERSGPFSAFPGVDRSSMLLGAGRIDLSAGGEPPLHLQRPGDVVAYPGDVVWNAAVQRDGPPPSLFNVMTRRGAAQAQLKAVREDTSLIGQAMAVLVINGRWRVVDASAEPDSEQRRTLAPGDGAFSEMLSLQTTLRWCIERLSPSGILAAIVIDRNVPG